MAVPIPFAQGFYQSESLPLSAQECVNFYPNIPQTNTLSQQTLFSTPGITEITDTGDQTFNRGMHVFDGVPYAVNGDELFRIDRTIGAFGVVTYDAVSVGTGITGNQQVVMADNGPPNSDAVTIPALTLISSVTDSLGFARFNLLTSFSSIIIPGSVVTLSGFSVGAYNGTFVVTVSDSTDFFETGIAFNGSSGGAVTGTIPGGAGQLCIVVPESDDQFNMYIYSPQTGFNQISNPDFDGAASAVVYVDSYFLFTKKDGKKFFTSGVNNGFSYNALDFAAANVDTDPIRAPFVLRNELFIFGSETFEAFQNIGGTGFPFIRIEGAAQDKGIDAPLSLAEVDGNMVWIGSDEQEQPAIWISNGGKPQKISTTAIDNQIRQYSSAVINSAFSVTYSQSGALFVAFTFPSESTFVYDAVSQLWHTRESTLSETQQAWRVASLVRAYQVPIVGDSFSNKIGLLDKDVYTEYGEFIKRRFVTPPLDNNGNPFFVSSIELVGETGIGNLTDPGQDAEVLLSFSDNGGRTFSDAISRSFGTQGDYTIRCIWDQLGRAPRSRMFRFQVSDPVKWAFYKVEANLD